MSLAAPDEIAKGFGLEVNLQSRTKRSAITVEGVVRITEWNDHRKRVRHIGLIGKVTCPQCEIEILIGDARTSAYKKTAWDGCGVCWRGEEFILPAQIAANKPFKITV